MTPCVVCPPRGPDDGGHEPDRERGHQCCATAYLRLAGALNAIPDRVDELLGLGYVERDALRYPRVLDRSGEPVPHHDPVANLWPAGPVPGQRGGAKVHAAPSSVPPLSLDVVDLTSGVNHEARRLLARGVLGLDDDQVGHLSAATILHGWVRDWADIRREAEPMPTVRELSRWLSDRLDWACEKHPALDEFARDLFELQAALDAITGQLPARPQRVDRPCPACGWWALSKAPGEEYIRCGRCDRALTDDEYREHLEDVIKTNWTVVDHDDAKTWPPDRELVWLRADDGVTVGFTAEFAANGLFLSMWGQPLAGVSLWAPIAYPADPGPPKVENPGAS